jgi:hypothetical protein
MHFAYQVSGTNEMFGVERRIQREGEKEGWA